MLVSAQNIHTCIDTFIAHQPFPLDIEYYKNTVLLLNKEYTKQKGLSLFLITYKCILLFNANLPREQQPTLKSLSY